MGCSITISSFVEEQAVVKSILIISFDDAVFRTTPFRFRYRRLRSVEQRKLGCVQYSNYLSAIIVPSLRAQIVSP
jgi:hypothetical protein